MNIKHSKYKNTGILFELLVRQITADTLSGKDSKATNILKPITDSAPAIDIIKILKFY